MFSSFLLLSLFSTNSFSQTDLINVSNDILNVNNIESQISVEITTRLKLNINTDGNNFSNDPDVISYLPMDAYDTNSYNYEKAPLIKTETYNAVNRFGNATTRSPENISLTAGKYGKGLNFNGGYLSQGLFNTTVNELRKKGHSYSLWIKPAENTGTVGLLSSGA